MAGMRNNQRGAAELMRRNDGVIMNGETLTFRLFIDL